MKGKFSVVFLILLVVALLAVLSYRGNGIKTYPLYETSSMRGFHVTHKDSDKIKWELMAKNATFPKGSGEVVLNDLIMKIHFEHELKLTGRSGIYNIQEKTLTVKKPLEVDIQGAKLITNSLMWNGREGIITTRNNITFKGKNFLIEGKGLNVKVKHQQIRILKDVKGIFYR